MAQPYTGDGSNIDILFVRMDRMGDLILTLPVDEIAELSQKKVHWWVCPGFDFIFAHSQPQRSFTPLSKSFSLKKLWSLVWWLRRHQVKSAVVFHAPWWIGLALLLGGVQLRVGRFSQWHSFLLFNAGRRQKRSLGQRHESRYNFELVEALINHKIDEEVSNKAYLKIHHGQGQQLIRGFQLEPQGYYVVHPGMAGSALNWPADLYVELIQELLLLGKVVITGTDRDEKYLDPIRSKLPLIANIKWLVGKLDGEQLIAVLQNAGAVVAPSTGVLHLAASCGVPVLGLFSPRPAEQAQRWAPRGPKAYYIQPDVEIRSDWTGEVMRKMEIKTVKNKFREMALDELRSRSE